MYAPEIFLQLAELKLRGGVECFWKLRLNVFERVVSLGAGCAPERCEGSLWTFRVSVFSHISTVPALQHLTLSKLCQAWKVSFRFPPVTRDRVYERKYISKYFIVIRIPKNANILCIWVGTAPVYDGLTSTEGMCRKLNVCAICLFVCVVQFIVWCNFQDLVSRMTLEEKIEQIGIGAPALERLAITQYQYWTEALHGVAGSPGSHMGCNKHDYLLGYTYSTSAQFAVGTK